MPVDRPRSPAKASDATQLGFRTSTFQDLDVIVFGPRINKAVVRGAVECLRMGYFLQRGARSANGRTL